MGPGAKMRAPGAPRVPAGTRSRRAEPGAGAGGGRRGPRLAAAVVENALFWWESRKSLIASISVAQSV